MKGTSGHITLLFVMLFGMNSFLSAHVVTFRGISMTDGLSDLLVNVIYKDSTGFVWLGTDNSLDRFDGIHIKHYPFSSADVKRKRVTAIAETDSKYLWVGNGLGLWQLNRYTDTMEHIAPETVDCGVSALLSDGRGKLYIGTDKGLFIHEAGTFKRIMFDSNILSSTNHIVSLTLSNDSRVWVLTPHDLYSFDPADDKITLHKTTTNTSYSFRCITQLDSTLYIGTNNQGIIQFDISTGKYSKFTDVGCNVISSISTDGKDLIYVSTDGNGIHFLSHSRKMIVNSYRHDAKDKASIRSNSVYYLLVDKENILWIGFYQAGFDYSLYQSGLFSVYDFPPYFDSMNMQVRSFLIHGNQKLIGTRDGLFFIDEDKNLFKTFLMPKLRANLILSINTYRGEYYIGTYGGGLSVLNPQTLTVRDFTEGTFDVFRNGHIFCLRHDTKGNLWLGTSEGVFCYNKTNETLRQYTHVNSQLPEGNVYEIFFDSIGKGWICTENGMALYDPISQSLKTNVFPEGFAHKEKIRSIYEDSNHNLYFLPDKGSMITSNATMSHFYRTPMKLILNGNAYMSIVEDENHWMWLGCDDGLLRTKEGEDTYYVYNFSDGIPSSTFTNNAAYRDENGVLWFGNAKGLLYVDPKNINETSRNPYKIVLTEVRVNGNALDADKKQELLFSNALTLERNQNNVTFNFVSLSYTDPTNMIYEYKLDGMENEWKHISGTNGVSYYDLASGSYTFRVRIPGDDTSEINVSVTIPPTIPIWFWILVLFVTIALYWLSRFWFVRMRKSLMNKKQVFHPQNQSVATAIADHVNKTTEEKYKTNRLTEAECKSLLEKLSRFVDEKKPYTNPDLKIADLANAIDTSSHSLSYLFNQHLNQSYYDFINEYRIAEFKQLANTTEYSRYTLSALAELCGFSSRASFFRSFKKSTGITPNEYIRSIGGTNE